ncbi:MAG: hypothetical protein QOI12_1015 [Alphaproteobacteria bacterium]|jgi:nitrate reductase delta subunit|nr:hypothetical protein [Alphaproteobacteria bacterium]
MRGFNCAGTALCNSYGPQVRPVLRGGRRNQEKPVSEYESAIQAWQAGPAASGEGAAMPESFRIPHSFKKSPQHVAALDRVRAWTRERFELPDDAAILVSQVSCMMPGCPPLETVVAFWTDVDRRHQFKLFKPVMDVAPDDLPPRWMRNALAVLEGIDGDCC